MQPVFRYVNVLDLFLNRDNPRHTHKNNQEEIIESLLRDEEVYNLAKHMSKMGINPLEVVAVYEDDDGNLVVAEGNRRICAAQLLTDVDKAPEKSRARFKSLERNSADVSHVNVAIFKDYETAQPWLQVLHDGEQDGVGRRRWKPEQKARATTNRNNDSLTIALLDYAEKEGIIDSEFRQKLQISTVTRYLANPPVRHALGLISMPSSQNIEIFTDKARFESATKHFLEGIQDKRLHSRSKTEDWLNYATEVNELFGEPFVKPTSSITKVPPPKALKPTNQKPVKIDTKLRLLDHGSEYVNQDNAVVTGLNALESYKLSSIYRSITTLKLDEHPALITTGAWMFVETLSAIHGRNASSDFVSYLNGKFAGWGISKDAGKDCRLSLEYVSQHGNAQKHSAMFTSIDARNLRNHFDILSKVFVALIDDCLVNKKK